MATMVKDGNQIEYDEDIVWRWIEALESGHYTQTTGTLRRGNCYCATGVLCDILYPDSWMPWTGLEDSWIMKDVYYNNRVSTSTMTVGYEVARRVGMEIDNDYDLDRELMSIIHISSANNHGASFARIAQSLRDYYGIYD